SNVFYLLTWTSTSTNIMVEMAGHLAVSGDGTGDSWGPTLGSSQISGGPYHFHLGALGGRVSDATTCPQTLDKRDVVSLGSQDNQIKGADILVPCSITGPTTACSGATNLTFSGPSGSGVTYSWSFSGAANGATFCSGTTSQTVCVTAGTGNFTIQLAVTSSGGTTICTQSVTVGTVTLSLTKTDVSCNAGSDGSVTATFSGGTGPYTISIDGGAFVAATSPKTFSGLGAGSHSVTVNDANGCTATQSITVNQPTAVTLSLTETDVSCNGGSDGTVTATFGGGTAPYTISIDGGGFVAATSPKTF